MKNVTNVTLNIRISNVMWKVILQSLLLIRRYVYLYVSEQLRERKEYRRRMLALAF